MDAALLDEKKMVCIRMADQMYVGHYHGYSGDSEFPICFELLFILEGPQFKPFIAYAHVKRTKSDVVDVFDPSNDYILRPSL